MKEVEKLVESLHPLERAIMPVLGKTKDVNSIKDATNLKEVEITRALGWLEAKNIVKLKKETKEYVFECQYQEAKVRRGTNQGIEIMRFQNVYPRRGKIVPAFASEITRILAKYPKEYKPLEVSS